MERKDIVVIDGLFLETIKNLDLMLESDFYKEKDIIIKIKEHLKNWYEKFNISNNLLAITPDDLKSIDLEVTELFSQYIKTESPLNNYSEILSYNLSNIKRYWKDEIEKRRK